MTDHANENSPDMNSRPEREKELTLIQGPQTAKVLAILTSIVSLLIFVPIALIMFLVAGMSGDSERTKFLVMGSTYLIMPLIYLPLMYIFIRIYCWMYNKVAKRFGGIRFTLEDLS